MPACLDLRPGLNSGYMIVQYTSAALALKNCKLASSDIIFSLPTEDNSEDHNSNSFNAVLHCLEVIENVRYILANEIMCAIKGIYIRKKSPPYS